MFSFTEAQYNEFKKFMEQMNAINWGGWPSSSEWLTFPGLPAYSLNQYETDAGKVFTVVKFDKAVMVDEERQGNRFHIGKPRGYTPNCERF
ncbi:MAG TPA: hypothetical protein VIO15_10345 [Bacteroidales bacterium]